MPILVTGGAGYIGSHVVKQLVQAGEEVVVFDNLSTGHQAAIRGAKLIKGDLSDQAQLDQLFSSHLFESILHFAASIVVSQSVSRPLEYYANNTINTHRLIRSAEAHGVKHFIFSSTAAVYGLLPGGLCDETSPTVPINPYGHSKLMSEQMLRDACAVGKMKSVILRYFNVAGADPDGELGQSFPDATHLIKVACQVATGKRPKLSVYGTDYPTPDGTCVRDYIHVTDLARAHVQALSYLKHGGTSQTLNCGYGHGSSVKEVIERVRAIAGVNFPVEMGPRREGDAASLTAAVSRIHQVLGWRPQYDDLDFIIRTSLDWEKHATY